MDPVRASRHHLSLICVLTAVAALSMLALGDASASAATCPSFRVLHNDRIGPANLPAGSYSVTTEEGIKGGLVSCQDASKLFARFLRDWDGNLPNDWRVKPEGRGKASFARKSFLESPAGFSVRRIGGRGGSNNEFGRLCTGTFTVSAGTDVGPLFFAKDQYLVYIPTRSAITCRRASVLFTRFLGSPSGQLPLPWRVKAQTATFYKPERPLRSAFRIEPEDGIS